jgi:hypothetical protein
MLFVEYSDNARIDYLDNIDYLEREWPLSVVKDFIFKTDRLIDLLSKGNLTFKPTGYKNTFEAVIIKQITLFYSVENEKIVLHHFWNNYQDKENFSL